MRKYDVIVVGGGLAGAAAAIRLAGAGAHVALFDRDAYPRHRLCGEFLSIEVRGLLNFLGAADEVLQAGACPIRKSVFTAPGDIRLETELPGVGLGLSRYALELILIRKALAGGVALYTGHNVQRVEGSLKQGFGVEAGGERYEARAIIGAYGKRSNLDRVLARPFFEKQTPLVAFKAYYEGPPLPETVEVHGFRGGYCGLCQVETGLINVCWIAHRSKLKQAGDTPEGMIENVFTENAVLSSRMRSLRCTWERHIAISQVSLGRKSAVDDDILMVGDAAGMIAPLCGDGMAMALQSGVMAAAWMQRFLEGSIGRRSLATGYASAWKRAFGARMRIGRVLHGGFIRPMIGYPGMRVMGKAPAVMNWVVASTRGREEYVPA